MAVRTAAVDEAEVMVMDAERDVRNKDGILFANIGRGPRDAAPTVDRLDYHAVGSGSVDQSPCGSAVQEIENRR